MQPDSSTDALHPLPPHLNEEQAFTVPLPELARREPDLWLMLEAMVPVWPAPAGSLLENLPILTEAALRENGLDREQVAECVRDFLRHFSGAPARAGVACITLQDGRGKNGTPEMETLELRRGEVVCLVGPTGAGKSQLLNDLECLAQGDTPSRRRILLDGREPDDETRFSIERKLVAQLTQNMNFVMDLPALEFITLHARSRLKAAPEQLAAEVLEQANALAGERFAPQTPLTSLSGGQSRALMIADTALISDSPVVLIDEIENAGVDRRRALELLSGSQKIIVLATHDPVLALLCDRRVNIRDGAIRSVRTTTDAEKMLLQRLLQQDEELCAIRTRLRSGEEIGG